MVIKNAGNGTLVQLVDNADVYLNSPYIRQGQYVFFEEERPAIILDSYAQGNVRYYKVMLIYTGEILRGVPENLLQENKLVLWKNLKKEWFDNESFNGVWNCLCGDGAVIRTLSNTYTIYFSNRIIKILSEKN